MSKYYAIVKDDRNQWRTEQEQQCMFCCASGLSLEIHEIERRSHAKNRWGMRCNYLLLCGSCHHRHFDTMAHSRQLAVKLVMDPEHFDLETWLKIRDPSLNAPTRVTLRDIVEHLAPR
jgi:hypothetical protein